jgi:AcrR family transcriptional regulator
MVIFFLAKVMKNRWKKYTEHHSVSLLAFPRRPFMAKKNDQQIDFMRKMPTQQRAEKTVSTIFEATIQVLQEEGEDRLTTNRIAERAGFSIGTLYQYFPGKDAIILAIIELERKETMRRLEAVLEKAEVSAAHPADYVRPFIRVLIERFSMGSAVRRKILKTGWRLDHSEPVIAATQAVARRMGEALRRRQHPDLNDPDDELLFVVTRAVIGPIRAAVMEDSSLPGTQSFEDNLVRLATVMMFPGHCP